MICQAILLNPWPLGLQALALPVSAPGARVARWLAALVVAWPELGFKRVRFECQQFI